VDGSHDCCAAERSLAGSAAATKAARQLSDLMIVTRSVKGVYQNPTYMNESLTPRICLANTANPD
ncbi:MAG: hypothetical protein M3Q94_02545, partial [Pseudomonadota bacterium]|nr:hypothetical protein [Pseudomonadota bacterium]